MKTFKRLTYPYILWIAAMIVIPMLLIVLYALTKQGNDVATLQFTLENFIRFFTDVDFLSTLWISLKIAFLTTILCILIGYPIAYLIANSKPKQRNLYILLITLPMWINMLVRTYAWIGILSDNGLINYVLQLLGFEPQKLLYTDFAVVLGMVYNFIPFMILQIESSLAKLDNSLLDAANDLGADRFHRFMKVTLPLSLPGVISGITLVFLPAVSSFVIPKLMGGGGYMLIGNVIENQFITVGEWNFGSAISMIQESWIRVMMLWQESEVRHNESP